MANITISTINTNENYVIYKKILKCANIKKEKNENSFIFFKNPKK
jgi:hypothetical protein